MEFGLYDIFVQLKFYLPFILINDKIYLNKYGGINMKYRTDKYGNKISILGYGCMRFTQKAGKIDLEKAEKEIMTAYEAGVNYYDTAYIYPGSEALLGEVLEKNNLEYAKSVFQEIREELKNNEISLTLNLISTPSEFIIIISSSSFTISAPISFPVFSAIL